MKHPIITFTGDLGSGKSTVARELATLLDAAFSEEQQKTQIVTMGQVFRDYAIQQGLSVNELNERAKKDSSIDRMIDNQLKAMGPAEHFTLLDSRLGWLFVQDPSIKVKLTISTEEAARRVYNDASRKAEARDTLEQVNTNLLLRREKEVARYLTKYAVDITKDGPFDMVIDTESVAPKDVAKCIFNLSMRIMKGEKVNKYWASPRILFPTEDIRWMSSGDGISEELLLARSKVMKEKGGLSDEHPIMLYADSAERFVCDGHHRLAETLIAGTPLVPVAYVKDPAPQDLRMTYGAWAEAIDYLQKMSAKDICGRSTPRPVFDFAHEPAKPSFVLKDDAHTLSL